jgi:hypothetical protein
MSVPKVADAGSFAKATSLQIMPLAVSHAAPHPRSQVAAVEAVAGFFRQAASRSQPEADPISSWRPR